MFGSNPYAPRRDGFRKFLLVLAIIFGLYFLNLAFPVVKLPASLLASIGRYINIATAALLVLLGIMTVVRPRMY